MCDPNHKHTSPHPPRKAGAPQINQLGTLPTPPRSPPGTPPRTHRALCTNTPAGEDHGDPRPSWASSAPPPNAPSSPPYRPDPTGPRRCPRPGSPPGPAAAAPRLPPAPPAAGPGRRLRARRSSGPGAEPRAQAQGAAPRLFARAGPGGVGGEPELLGSRCPQGWPRCGVSSCPLGAGVPGWLLHGARGSPRACCCRSTKWGAPRGRAVPRAT